MATHTVTVMEMLRMATTLIGNKTMELINDFSVGQFCRTVWVNSKAREVWEQPIREIATTISWMELESVDKGQRKCATLTVSPQEINKYQTKYPNLIFKILRLTKKFSGFSHKHEDPGPGEDFYIYCVVGKTKKAIEKFTVAHNAGDNFTQGQLLGFPACCCRFFEEVWPGGYVDPIWQSALNSLHTKNGGDEIRIAKAHPYSTAMLRYIGLRVGFHIPCSFHCKETIKTSEKRLKLMENKNQAELLRALLSMPMTWDCNHGAAMIKTPIFWIVTASNPTTKRHIVNVDGSFIPREAPSCQ